ncbi:lysozyme-like protein, partial [Basidiobolus meristosporus CBS 931.73]
NQADLDLVQSIEGWFPNFYIGPAGIRTIGYGHTCHSDPTHCANIYPPLFVARGEDLLRRDMAEFEECVSELILVPITSNRVLHWYRSRSMSGVGGLRNSNMRRLINQENNNAAEAEFGLWVYGGGRVLPGLVRRRKAEHDLFSSGIAC